MDGLRISDLAERVEVSVSTVRYYERIGLVPAPRRSASGYRLYDADAEARLLFITRGKRLGLSLEEIADLLAIWDGTNCGPTQERLSALLAAKQVEIRQQIQELERFADQLADVEARLLAAPVVDGCAPDLACCAPELADTAIAVSSSGGRSGGTGSPPNEVAPIACTMTSVERSARRLSSKRWPTTWSVGAAARGASGCGSRPAPISRRNCGTSSPGSRSAAPSCPSPFRS